MIPIELQKPEFRFIKLSKATKTPVEKWKDKNYNFDNEELHTWIESNSNYGLIMSDNLIVIDADDEPFISHCALNLPETFTVKSRKGFHYYYFTNDKIKKQPILTSEKKHCGDLIAKGGYITCPNSIHPSGAKYEIWHDVAIKTLSWEKLTQVLGEYLPITQNEIIKEDIDSVNNNAQISSLLDLKNFKQNGNKYQGSHPVHGSDGGCNFAFDTDKNEWYCFRHNVGGGFYSLLAILEGIIDCSEAGKNCLRGHKFIEVLNIAKSKGLINNEDSPLFETFFTYNIEKSKYEYDKQKVGKWFIKNYNIKNLSESNDLIYFDGKKYSFGAEKLIPKVIFDNYSKATKNTVAETLFYIQENSRISTEEFFKEKRHLVLDNGVFDLLEKKLLPHSPKFKILTSFPISYDASLNVEDSKIIPILKETVSTESEFLRLQEWVGYCFLRDYKFQKALMLIGEGSNGKSTWIEVIRSLIGEQNYSSQTLHSLTGEKTFAINNLYQKYVNISADISKTGLKETGFFKMLTSGKDPIQADRKFKDPIQFVNFAKLIFSCNELPWSYDNTMAFYRRWDIVFFPFTYLPKLSLEQQQDPRYRLENINALKPLEDKKEISILFNWALDGLYRLLENKRFTEEIAPDKMKILYNRLSDSLAYFVDEHVETGDSDEYEISKTDFYDAYSKFCKINNLPVISDNVVGQRMKQLANAYSTRPRINGKRVQVWKGIKVIFELPNLREQVKRAIELFTKDNDTINKCYLIDKQFKNHNPEEVNNIIDSLIKEGCVFEPRHGELKYV